MDNFTATCAEGDLVGIHCTHGVNRTGYLICRYLVQQLGWEVEDSLKAFEEARGYPIEREAYVSALKETPRGEKIDTSKVVLSSPALIRPNKRAGRLKRFQKGAPYPMNVPHGFGPSRRGFPKDGSFPPQQFGFGGPPPGFGPMPPPLRMPPIPPPPGPPMYGPRPFRYGPPPGPGFPIPGFPPRIPGPPRMAGPSRLPGPPARLPPPKMPPPPPPPLQSVRPVTLDRHQAQKKKQHMRNGLVVSGRNSMRLIRRNNHTRRVLPKAIEELDFTVDTFEENLLTGSTNQQRRTSKGRFRQGK